jgi:CheY-like chemotaxis protein
LRCASPPSSREGGALHLIITHFMLPYIEKRSYHFHGERQRPPHVLRSRLFHPHPETGGADYMTAELHSNINRDLYSPTVLIADDDVATRRFIAETLKKDGYTTIIYDPSASQLLNGSYDVVMAEFLMRDKACLSISKEMLIGSPNAEFIIMVNQADIEKVGAVIENKLYSFLIKPFKAMSVLSAVRRALHLKMLLTW